jgi:hypothetical protein
MTETVTLSAGGPDVFSAALRGDRHKNPETAHYRYLTYNECLTLESGDRVPVLDYAGRVATVKITSVKTWKRRPDLELHWKWGLYEFGTETIYPDRDQRFFITKVYDGFKTQTGRDPIPGKDYDPDNLSQDDYEYYTGTGIYR